MRVVGYLQLRNELKNGNLYNVLENMSLILGDDNFVIFDDGSDDGSQEVYSHFTDHVIHGKGGEFTFELSIKQRLLDYCRDVLKGDWIVWQDGDTIFDRAGTDEGKIMELIKRGEAEGVTGWGTHWLNCYLHPRWYRTDQQFNDFGQMCLYKIEPGLKFDLRPGLHQKQTPNVSNMIDQSDVEIIHLGFASPKAIEQKYVQYWNCGQRGWALERLISTFELQLQPIPDDRMPSHYCPDLGEQPAPMNFDYLRKKYPALGLDRQWEIDEYRCADE
jgi:hypothetical protein